MGNTLLQKVCFQSGSSIGSGLTYELEMKEVDGTVYMDTPGLMDTRKREAAANAITLALRQEGHYRVMAVVTLEQGRIRPDDVSLLKLVLDSAIQLTAYSLVLNQVNKAVKRKLPTDQDLYQMLMENGIEEKYLPKRIYVMDRNDDIDGEDNRFLTNADDFIEFVKNAPAIEIHPEKVNDIPIETYDELRSELASKVEEIKTNNIQFTKQIKALMDQAKKDQGALEKIQAEKLKSDAAVNDLKGKVSAMELDKKSSQAEKLKSDATVNDLKVKVSAMELEKKSSDEARKAMENILYEIRSNDTDRCNIL